MSITAQVNWAIPFRENYILKDLPGLQVQNLLEDFYQLHLLKWFYVEVGEDYFQVFNFALTHKFQMIFQL